MKKISLLRIVIFVETIILLVYVSSISIDYQDSWVLERLEIPYTIFIITLIFYFMIENKINWLILITLISRTTLLLIPNLKYFWFQGVATDQFTLYKLALVSFNEGNIAQNILYSETPLFPLSFTILSLVSGISIVQSAKFFPLMLWFTYPIWIYIFTRKLNLGSSINKYALMASFMPVKLATSYVITGSMFGVFFMFIILIKFSDLFIKKDRNIWIVIMIFISALVLGHTVSSIMLSATLVIVLIITSLLNIFYSRVRVDILHFDTIKLSYTSVISVIIMSITWLSLVTKQFFYYSIIHFVGPIYKILNIPSQLQTRSFIPQRFWEISSIDQLKTLLVLYGASLFLIVLTVVTGLLILRDRELRKRRNLNFLFFGEIALGSLFFMGLILSLGAHWYDRIMRYFIPFTPVFVGIFFKRIENKKFNKLMQLFVMCLLVTLATVELYRCQPIVPTANALSENLPDDIPIVYVVNVNTAYQRYMVTHAILYLPDIAHIALDEATRNQLYGLASSDYLQNKRFSFPLRRSYPQYNPSHYLIHLPGISGKFQEQVENRTTSVILSILYDSNSTYNLIYSNAESFILARVS